MNTFEVKTIRDVLICNNTYFCPKYQRGYKWRKVHVEALLDDIDKFIPNEVKKYTKYCLQPIVLHKIDGNENKYTLIDGQQRLTTLSIILRYLGADGIATIDYETRTGSKDFLLDIAKKDKAEADKNIDFHHMYQAYKTIKEWFEDDNNYKDIEINKFKNDFKNNLLDKVSVIWYEIKSDSSKDDNDVFTRLNSGKIPLTNSELIKALFLQNYHKDSDNEKDIIRRQAYRGSEWDMIEQTLRNSDFWGFINKTHDSYANNRIEYIFNLICEKDSSKQDDYHVFNVYKKAISDDDNADKKWKEIKDYFNCLEEWYQDRSFFHLIGYLVNIGKSIKDIKKMYDGSYKLDFKKKLEDEIKNKFAGVDIDNLEYGKDNKTIRELLLLFNIVTMLKNDKSNSRFQFDLYQSQKWDIEHIYPKATHDIKEKELQNAREYEKLIDLNSLANLTLLDSGTNRGYKDASFLEKRKIILDKSDLGTSFVPVCTRDIFIKAYSQGSINMEDWTSSDGAEYLQTIKNVLKDYLGEDKGDQFNGK